MAKYSVIIPDTPIPLKRARASKGRFYDPQYDVKKRYSDYVMTNIDPAVKEPLKEALIICLVFYIPMPKSWSKKKREATAYRPHTQTPDCDNLIKFFQDSLNGKLFEDDRQIAVIEAVKLWTENEGKTYAFITEYQPKVIMDTDSNLMLRYIEDIAQECRNFLDHSEYANVQQSEHMLKLSIIGHNLCAKFEMFEKLRVRGEFKNGRT